MIWLAYFILIFEIMRFGVALFNLIIPQKIKGNTKINDLVSVLIPARNEENNIGKLLGDLKTQDYKYLEILVYDDFSDDNTAKVVSEHAARDNRIKIIPAQSLPELWLGKNHACHRLAQSAHGKYLLFLDADVRLDNTAVGKTLGYLQKHNLKLLSVFPMQQMVTTGEWLTVPIMNYILLSLLPLFLVRISKFTSLSAANGQFMFFEAETYQKLQPHLQMKSNKVEDIAIARYFKKKKQKIACLASCRLVNCRMYTNFNDALGGFSRNVIAYFGNSFLLAILFFLLTTFGFIIVWIAFGIQVLLSYLLLILSIKSLVARAGNQSLFQNIILYIPHQMVLGLLLWKAFTNKINNKHQWKGRYIH